MTLAEASEGAEDGSGAQKALFGFLNDLVNRYEKLLPYDPETTERWETTALMKIERDGKAETLYAYDVTLEDVPDVLRTLDVMEAAARMREAEEKRHKDEECKERNRIRAKERRQRKKLGEW